MDGIAITQVVAQPEENDIFLNYDYSMPVDDISEQDIAQMIELNEGPSRQSSPSEIEEDEEDEEDLGSPDFKHIVKLTSSTFHPSLKRRSYTKRSDKEKKEDVKDNTKKLKKLSLLSVETRDARQVLANFKIKIKNKKKILITLAQEEKSRRREILRLKRTIAHLNEKLRTRLIQTQTLKTNDGVPRRGRPIGSSRKLLDELGINSTNNTTSPINKVEPEDNSFNSNSLLVARSGRPRKLRTNFMDYILKSSKDVNVSNLPMLPEKRAVSPTTISNTPSSSNSKKIQSLSDPGIKRPRGRPKKNPEVGLPIDFNNTDPFSLDDSNKSIESKIGETNQEVESQNSVEHDENAIEDDDDNDNSEHTVIAIVDGPQTKPLKEKNLNVQKFKERKVKLVLKKSNVKEREIILLKCADNATKVDVPDTDIDNESQAVDNESEAAENEPQAVDNEYQAAENEPQAVDNEYQAAENEHQEVDNESQAAENEPQAVHNESQAAENEPLTVHNESQVAENKPQIVEREDVDCKLPVEPKQEEKTPKKVIKGNVNADADKLKSRKSLGMRKSRALIEEKIVVDQVVPKTEVDVKTPMRRRSAREVKFTPKLAEIMQDAKRSEVAGTDPFPNMMMRGTNTKVDDTLQKKVESLTDRFSCPFNPGNLVWLRLETGLLWPSIVIQDPFGSDEYSQVRIRSGGSPELFVHVQLLQERGRRSWIPLSSLESFHGLAQYQKLQSSAQVQTTKQWKSAVKSAEGWLDKPDDKRLALIRRSQPMERYGDCSLEESEAANITDILENPNKTMTVKDGNVSDEPNSKKSIVPIDNKRKSRTINSAGKGRNSKIKNKAVEDIKNETEVNSLKNTDSDTDTKVTKSSSRRKSVETKRKTKVEADKKNVAEVIDESKFKTKIEIKTEAESIKRDITVETDTKVANNGKRKRSGTPTRNNKKSKASDNAAVAILTRHETNSRGSDRASSVASDVSSVSALSVDEYERNGRLGKASLFKGLVSKKICEICMSNDNEATHRCSGPCLGFYHPLCQGDSTVELPQDGWVCIHCRETRNLCFVCKEATGTRQMCLAGGCGKFYHAKCLKLFPQTKFNHGKRKNTGLQEAPKGADAEITDGVPLEISSCAKHTCHTCSSDHPADAACVPLNKLVHCVQCPTSYHPTSFCLPAGTEILSATSILCGKHFSNNNSRTVSHVNISWCFLCARGGELICCDLCPASIHVECQKLKPPEGSYACEECESGRFPLYGEIVWVKLGNFRWWPSKILFPHEIPINMTKLPRRLCEFVVKFYGTHDYQWTNRGRVYLFQEGDRQKPLRQQKRIEKSFQLALDEAANEFAIRKAALATRNNTLSAKPAHYVKIRANKYTKEVGTGAQVEPPVCDCRPEDEEPCGPLTDCLNRVLQIECHPNLCTAGSRCANQRFQKRQYTQLQPLRTPERGWGLISPVDLVRGQFIIEYIGEVITSEEMEERSKIKQQMKDPNFYFFRLDSSRVLDAGPMGNLARFANHSCSPNCEPQKWTVNGSTRIGLFSLQDIPKNTELTFNYAFDCVGGKNICCCGSDSCSGFIGEPLKSIKKTEVELNKMKKKSKAKKKAKKAVEDKINKSECHKCSTSGELMLCDAPDCTTLLHVACAGLEQWPIDEWFCQRHVCSLCKTRTKRHCQACLVAFCSRHTEGNLTTSESGALFCSQHIPLPTKLSSRSTRRQSLFENKLVVTEPIVAEYEEFKQKENMDVDTGPLDLFNDDDLVPAVEADLFDNSILVGPNGEEVILQSELITNSDLSPSKKARRRTNIPRAKLYDVPGDV